MKMKNEGLDLDLGLKAEIFDLGVQGLGLDLAEPGLGLAFLCTLWTC